MASTKEMITKLPLWSSIVFLGVLLVALFLRREAVIADPVALLLVPLCVLGFAVCTVWAGVGTIRAARARR